MLCSPVISAMQRWGCRPPYRASGVADHHAGASVMPTASCTFCKIVAENTTPLMSTGLTFGSISALFGLTNHIIDERQYTILLTAVIGSAVVPTLIAERWFQPKFQLLDSDAETDIAMQEEP